MKALIATLLVKKSRIAVIAVVLAMVFVFPLVVPIVGNVSANVYTAPPGGNVSSNVYVEPPTGELPSVDAVPLPDVVVDIITPEIDYVAVTGASVTQEVAAAAMAAVAATAAEAAASTGAVITAVGSPVTVSVAEPNTVVNVTLPDDVDVSAITTMADFRADGSLVPVPTRVGSVIVLISGEVTLVPLNVEVNFTDIDMGAQFVHVTDEINLAASMMIVQGRGGGVFDPSAQVTGREASIMFLRAMGVPVDWNTAMATAQAQGLTGGATVADAPMTRVATAQMINNALNSLGVDIEVTPAEAAQILAGFADLEDLTDDELVALAVCARLGIFRGAGGNLMNPQGTLQRSHMASLVVRFQDVFLGM